MTLFSNEYLLFEPAIANYNAVPVIFAFPNQYSVGITSLGFQIIWSSLALRADLF